MGYQVPNSSIELAQAYIFFKFGFQAGSVRAKFASDKRAGQVPDPSLVGSGLAKFVYL